MREETKAQRRWSTPEIPQQAQLVEDAGRPGLSIPKPHRGASR